MFRKTVLFIAVLFLVIASKASCQDLTDKADAYLSTWAKQGRFSGVVLIAKDGKVVLRKGYGMANFELNVPNTPETVFRIGSITKMFTAFSILQLEERGKLKVSDPVIQYIPELPRAWSAITIHQLLCHKSGIPEFLGTKAYNNQDDPLRVENALKEFADKPLVTAPGEVLRYSNSGYILLGRIVEKVSGKSYEEYLTENILTPAGMTHTAFDHYAPVVPNRANGYNFDGEFLINTKPGDSAMTGPAGALRSTADDLYTFDRVLRAGTLFSSAITQKAWTAYGHWSARPPITMEAEYGYGWMIGQDFGHRYLAHGGWVNGFVSDFKRYPDDNVVVILLSNIEMSSYMALSRDLTAMLFEQPYEVPVARKIVHPEEPTLARYVGDYQLGPLDIQISMRNGRLYAFSTGQPTPFGMIATSDTDFYFNDAASEIHFVVDPDGKVRQFMLKMDGKTMPVSRRNEQTSGN